MGQVIERFPVMVFGVSNIVIAVLIVLFFPDINVQFVPGILAVFILFVRDGKASVRRLLQRMELRRKYLGWYGIALFVPVVICGLAFGLYSFMNGRKLDSLELVHPLGEYGIFLLYCALGSCGEEVGWRGFLLPQLLQKYSLRTATLFIGLFWGFWHLKFLFGLSVFVIYALLVVEFSYVMSWLYTKTYGNILAAIICHTSINLCSILFFEKVVMTDIPDGQKLMEIYGMLVLVFFPLCAWIFLSDYKSA